MDRVTFHLCLSHQSAGIRTSITRFLCMLGRNSGPLSFGRTYMTQKLIIYRRFRLDRCFVDLIDDWAYSHLAHQ